MNGDAIKQSLAQIGQRIEEYLGQDCLGQGISTIGELTITIKTTALVKAMGYLRDDAALKFNQLVDVCGVDWPQRGERFDIVYHLLSLVYNRRLRIKVQVAEGQAVDSVCGIFSSANWFEREVFDMYGVSFNHHPDLRRILTDYGFEGYPLRKDFPLSGHVELHYDDALKKCVYRPVQLVQDFRSFDFLSPWEGPMPHQQEQENNDAKK